MRTTLLLVLGLTACTADPDPADDGRSDSEPARPVQPRPDSVEDSGRADTGPGEPSLPALLTGPRYASGTRLRVDVWDVPGGHDVLVGLFDRDLGVPCRVAVAADGVLRCLPLPGSVLTFYADPTCETPVHVLPADACVDSPFRWTEGATHPVCDAGPTQTVHRWKPVAPPDALYDGPSCRPVPVPDGATFVAHDPVDEPVPPADFVAFTRVDARVPGGLGLRFLVGDDGTVLAEAVLDDGGACRPEFVDETLRCVPEERARRSTRAPFADEACTEGVALDVRQGACPAPRVVVQDLQNDEVALYGVGAPWPGTAAWQHRTNGSCTPFDTGGGPLYRLGAELDPEAFPLVREEVAGTGPLRVRAWGGQGPALLPVDDPFEVIATDEPCEAAPFADGRVFCLPEGAVRLSAGATFFADEDCRVPIFQASVDDAEGWVPGERACAGGGAAVASAWIFGPRFVGNVYQGATGATCVLSFTTQQFPSVTWRIGVEVDPATLWPELRRVPR